MASTNGGPVQGMDGSQYIVERAIGDDDLALLAEWSDFGIEVGQNILAGRLQVGLDRLLLAADDRIQFRPIGDEGTAVAHEVPETHGLQGRLIAKDERHVRIVRTALVLHVDDLTGLTVKLGAEGIVAF